MIALSGTEVVGYIGSLVVVVSLTMTSVVRLRALSLVGSFTFIAYGLLIDSVPIVITNAAIAVINVWFLAREFSPRSSRGRDLGASQIRADSPFLLDFVEFHIDDICSFQPDFVLPAGPDVVAFVMTRDGLPAGLLVGRRDGDRLMIDLDYVLAAYRDSRIGRCLFGPGASIFRDAGIGVLCADAPNEAHAKYLERMGFEKTDDHYALAI